MAEGVLPVLLGPATRLADVVQSGHKQYHAEIQLGTATATDDAQGEVVASAPVPALSAGAVEAVLSRFRGTIDQIPPRYSAVNVGGQRAYALARRGDAVHLASRPVTMYALDLVWLRADALAVGVECSKGTYVRALARDVAQALGTVGHVRRLVRTRVGPFLLADALPLDEIGRRGIANVLLPADAVLSEAPVVQANDETVSRLIRGQPVPHAATAAERVLVYDAQGRLRLIGATDGRTLCPRILLLRDPDADGLTVPA